MVTREEMLAEVVERELAMFLEVRNRGGRADCQEQPEAFRLMRRMTHAVLSDAFAESYLEDLRRGEADGRNFMTEKYAVMEGQIPPFNPDPRIRDITRSECAWRDAIAAAYPLVVEADGGDAFRRYLFAELQTYSAATIGAYADCVATAHREDRNLAGERYELLMRELGFGSLAEHEAAMRKAGSAGARG